MHFYQEKKILPYPKDKLFEIVWDVKHYPDFLPWCTASRILELKEEGEIWEQKADLMIGFQYFKEVFRSEVRALPFSWVATEAIRGPFKRMKSHWDFEALEDDVSSAISFQIEFEFNSVTLHRITGKFFEHAARAMVDSFAKRAHDLLK